MLDLLTVSEAARRIEDEYGGRVTPKLLSDLIYRRQIPDTAYASIGGRRLILAGHLDEIVAALRDRGHLSEERGSPR